MPEARRSEERLPRHPRREGPDVRRAKPPTSSACDSPLTIATHAPWIPIRRPAVPRPSWQHREVRRSTRRRRSRFAADPRFNLRPGPRSMPGTSRIFAGARHRTRRGPAACSAMAQLFRTPERNTAIHCCADPDRRRGTLPGPEGTPGHDRMGSGPPVQTSRLVAALDVFVTPVGDLPSRDMEAAPRSVVLLPLFATTPSVSGWYRGSGCLGHALWQAEVTTFGSADSTSGCASMELI